jgi:hypothetical protein
MDCAIQSLNGSYRPAINQELIHTEDGVRIFGGLIDAPKEVGIARGATAGIVTAISAADFNVYPSRVTVAGAGGVPIGGPLPPVDRPAETLKARMTWIASILAPYGVTLDAAQVDGPSLVAASFGADRVMVDVLNETVALASGTGSIGYVWNIDYTKKLSARPADSSNPAPFAITDTNDLALGDITVDQPTPSTYANYIVVLGGTGSRDVTQTFAGDGSTVTFQCLYALITTYGAVVVDGVGETLGAGGLWTWDPATNRITRTTAPASGAVIVFTYLAGFPLRVEAHGSEPAGARKFHVYELPEVFDVYTLQALANSYYVRDSQTPKTVTYGAALHLTAVHPGQVQIITSTKRNLSGSHLITDVEIGERGGHVQRVVTAVSSQRVPPGMREQFQQVFGSVGPRAAAGSSSTVGAGGSVTYLNAPVSLGGSDITFRDAATWVRVPNALKYLSPATFAVRISGSIVAFVGGTTVALRLYDESGGAHLTGPPSTAPAGQVPLDYSFTGTVTVNHLYHLEMLSGTAAVPCAGIAQLEAL